MEDTFDYNEKNIDLFPTFRRDLIEQIDAGSGPLYEYYKEMQRIMIEADPYKGML